ncbi:collagen-like protein [Chitinophaga sp. HK235]|uniref:collagen-like protein n=1 Tax=Chitinophaga sp. HK235 TaxID=2952571 RepID=UPI001BA532B0|nr:collagen-like protein [Chitinophaga sp. HK235]
MRSLFISCVLLMGIIALSLNSCKKGNDGPVGPAGPAGATGPAGPAGSANVIYSPWVATATWTASTTSTGTGKKTFYFDINAPKVTQDVIDKGVVLVYMKFIADPDGAGIAKLLPSIYYNIGGADVQYRFQYGLFLNIVRVICDVVPNGIPANTNMVRYVIIPGGVTGARTAATDYSKMSYEKVCRLYNIPN